MRRIHSTIDSIFPLLTLNSLEAFVRNASVAVPSHRQEKRRADSENMDVGKKGR
jgi:hypothetical protein